LFYFHFGQFGTRHKPREIWHGSLPSRYLLMHFKNNFFIEVDGKRMGGKAGDFVLHAPNGNYAHGSLSAREGFINDWMFFSADDSELEFLQKMPYDRPVSNGDTKSFSKFFSEILTENLYNDEFSKALISNHIYQLLITLKRAETNENKAKNKLHHEFNELRLHIHKHCNQEWTLETMAKKSGYSASHFCALYKQFFGITPIDDLLNARLQTAKELIVLKNHKIGEIASLCGFSSIHYFSEFFKKKTGKSPSEYYTELL